MPTNYACTAKEAVARGFTIARGLAGQYGYGAGNYQPPPYAAPLTNGDVPWTPSSDHAHPGPASDCAGFAICFCWKIVRHRPGFNVGSWSTVSDDVNVNSAIEDGEHKQELFITLPPGTMPQPGDLLCYPTFKYAGKEFIGHVAIVLDVPGNYVPGSGWHDLSVIQCHGPDGFKPGAVMTDASHWDQYAHNWPTPFVDNGVTVDPRVKLVRPRERQ